MARKDKERGREHENEASETGLQTGLQTEIPSETVLETAGDTADSGSNHVTVADTAGAGTSPSMDSTASGSANGALKKTYLNTVTGEVLSPNNAEEEAKLGQDGEYVALEDVTVLKKIVAKAIVGRRGLSMRRQFEKDEKHKDGGYWKGDDPKPLYTIMGTCVGYKEGESDYGKFIEFEGNFEVVRTEDQARFASDRCFLQGPADKLLFDALLAVKQKDPNGSVTFAFEIGIKISDTYLMTGEGSSYAYTITSKINVKKHDPLAQLRAAVFKQLPAPKRHSDTPAS